MPPPAIHDLPSDILSRLLTHISSASPSTTCMSQTATLRTLTALACAHPSLRALARSADLIPALHPCESCAAAAPAARPLALAALLRFVVVADLVAPPAGWARAGVGEMLGAVRGTVGRGLRSLDVSAVELEESVHREGFRRLCESVSEVNCAGGGAGGRKGVEVLRVWGGERWVWEVLGQTMVVGGLRVFAVKGVERIRDQPGALECAKEVFKGVVMSGSEGGLQEVDVLGRGTSRWLDASENDEDIEDGLDEEIEDGFDEDVEDGLELAYNDDDTDNCDLADAFVDGSVVKGLRVLGLGFPNVEKALDRIGAAGMPALLELRLAGLGSGDIGIIGREEVASILGAAPKLERVRLRGVHVRRESFAHVVRLIGTRLVEFVGCYIFQAPSEMRLFMECCGENLERLLIACNEEEREELGIGVEDANDVFGPPIVGEEGGRSAGSCDLAVLQMALSLRTIGKIEELELDDGGLTFRSVEAVLNSLSTLRVLRLVFSVMPRKTRSFHFAMRYKSHLRTLVLDTRRYMRGHHVRWGLGPEHVTAVANAISANKCSSLLEFRSSLQFTTVSNNLNTKEELWKALNRLQDVAPNACLANIRTAVYHPYKRVRRVRRLPES